MYNALLQVEKKLTAVKGLPATDTTATATHNNQASSSTLSDEVSRTAWTLNWK